MELTIEQALHRGVVAHKEGELKEAERIYRAILQFQPEHPDANHNLGIIAVSRNEIEEALPLFKTALKASPKMEQFWLSYIDALIKQKQFEGAKEAIRQAENQGVKREKLGVLNAQVMVEIDSKVPSPMKLNSLLEHYQAWRYYDAELLAVSITKEFPDHQFSWKILGAIFGQIGRKSEALNANKKAVMLSPQDAEAHNNYGATLKELGRFDEAEAMLKQAVTLQIDFYEAHYNLGNTLQSLGRLDEAEDSYRQAIMFKPDYADAHDSLLKCLYLLGKQSRFFDELDHLINQDKTNAVIGSLTCRAALKYGEERPNPFCKDPLKYVVQTNLNTQIDFKKIVVEKSRIILDEDKISNRSQSLLVNGHQTSGNLFDIENDLTTEIQKAIRLEIEKYRINFKNSEEGLIKKWPTEYSLYGWLISMKSGGALRPHIHEQGWLSGSIYVNVPPKLEANSGNLVVALGEEQDATGTRKNSEQTIDVVTGDLVLFPASLTHYTIPFESEEERTVLAFDVVPS